MNPPRRRRRHHRRHARSNAPRRRRRHFARRRHHRNPSYGGRGIMSQVKAVAPAVGWGAVGFVGTSAVPGFASRFAPQLFPDKASSPVMFYVGKAVSALATGWLVGMFAGKKAGYFALAGGGINLASDAIVTFAGPTLGLSEYLDPGMQEYLEPGGPVGFLSPGETVSGYEDEPVSRMNPDNRI